MAPYDIANFTGEGFHGPPRDGFLMGPHTVLIIQIMIIALALFILWWILRSHYKRNRFSKNDTPLDILNKRYAAGEITKEEYKRIKDEIK